MSPRHQGARVGYNVLWISALVALFAYLPAVQARRGSSTDKSQFNNQQCSSRGMVIKNRCFFTIETELAWGEARQMCKKNGAEMVQLNDRDVIDGLNDENLSHDRWVAGSDAWEQGKIDWSYLDIKYRTDFTYWGDNTNTNFKNCLFARPGASRRAGSLRWYWDNCDQQKRTICEVRKDKNDNPATLLHFEKANNAVLNEQNTVVQNADSLEACANKCEERANCLCFQYKNKKCTLHEGTMFNEMPTPASRNPGPNVHYVHIFRKYKHCNGRANIRNPATLSCYSINGYDKTWREARSECIDSGGMLIVNDAKTVEFIKSYLPGRNIGKKYWTAENDRRVEGTYMWDMGSHQLRSPNNNPLAHDNRDCILMDGNEDWLEQSCGAREAFVCQYRIPPLFIDYSYEFKKYHGRLTLQGERTVNDVDNILTCFTKCQEQGSCKSVDFNSRQKTCHFYVENKFTSPSQFEESRHWEHFVHITRQYSHCPTEAMQIPDTNKCYDIHNVPEKWEQSRSRCELNGGYLMFYSDPELLDKIDFNQDYWIGLNRINDPAWTWNLNGKSLPINGDNWARNEPSAANKKCSVVTSANKWKSYRCNENKLGVCVYVLSIQQPQAPLVGYTEEPGVRLNVANPEILSVPLQQCVKECDQREYCLAFNFNEIDNECQILRTTSQASSSLLVNEPKWSHYINDNRKASHCPEGSFSPAGSTRCYKMFDVSTTWSNAEDLCKAEGGNLAIFPEKQALVSFKKLFPRRSVGSYWVGGKTMRSRGLVWRYRSAVIAIRNLDNWEKVRGRINLRSMFGKDRCMRASVGQQHKWKLVKCTQKHAALCEFRPASDVDFQVVCPTGWVPYNGFCYTLEETKLPAVDGERNCRRYGAHLASVLSRAENTYVSAHITENLGNDVTPVWIGLTDHKKEGTWKWIDRHALDYENWADEWRQADCTAITPATSQVLPWAARDCKSPAYFMCKGRPNDLKPFGCANRRTPCPSDTACIATRSGHTCACGPGSSPVIANGQTSSCQEGRTCDASGDPHYTTFDGRRINFQGTCYYNLASSCPGVAGVPADFSVHVHNEKSPKNPAVSVTQRVTVVVHGVTVQLLRDRRIMVDGMSVNLPQSLALGNVNVYLSGKRALVLKTDFGLRVSFENNHHAQVTVPPAYTAKMCGLCGNNNGDVADDFNLAHTAQKAADYFSFGNSWKILDESLEGEDCQDVPVPPILEECTEGERGSYGAEDKCGLLRMSAFDACVGKVAVLKLIEDCVFDMCLAGDDMLTVCNALRSYADLCHAAGVAVSWMAGSPCEPECPPHSTFKSSTSSCPGSCVDPEAPDNCGETEVEGCECDPEYLLSGADCVLVEACGCMDDGEQYRKVGESWGDSLCGKRYTCQAGGEIVMDDVSCHSLAECKVKRGVQGCHCRRGYEGDGVNLCDDVDECATPPRNPCPRFTKCVNADGSYKCEADCPPGLKYKRRRCRDVNECNADNGGCEEKCDNTHGSFICRCTTGSLAEDGTSCTDDSTGVCEDTKTSKRPKSLKDFFKNKKASSSNQLAEKTKQRKTKKNNEGNKQRGGKQTRRGSNKDRRRKVAKVNKTFKKGKVSTKDRFKNIVSTRFKGKAFWEKTVKKATHCGCDGGFEADVDGNCIDIDECQGSHGCPDNSRCKNFDGGFTCQCNSGSLEDDAKGNSVCSAWAQCSASGDPHYTTFDGLRYNFMGTCTYVLTKPCPKDEQTSVPDFNVQAKNVPTGSKGASITRYVVIDLHDKRIQIGPGQVVKVGDMQDVGGVEILVNAEIQSLPVNHPDLPDVDISLEGSYITLSTSYLNVRYDGGTKVFIKISADIYKNIGMCGLCGNYNEDITDEYQDAAGRVYDAEINRSSGKADYAPVGKTWEKVTEDFDEGCLTTPPPPSACDTAPEMTEAEQACAVIRDQAGAFKDCITAIETTTGGADVLEGIFDDCKYDVCAVEGSITAMVCAMLGRFADVCRSFGVIGIDWRTADFCPMMCGDNMEYMPSVSACAPTCTSVEQDPDFCPQLDVEGCACVEGYILSGDVCVLPDDCGCVHAEMGYYGVSEYYLSDDCATRHTCGADGDFEESDEEACHADASCRIEDGGRGCFCNEGLIGDGYETCGDENECETGNFRCSEHALCIDDAGGYHCECISGYTGDGKSCSPLVPCPAGFIRRGGECKDINECDGTPCGDNAVCVNTPGAFRCHCARGFSGDPYTKCFTGARCVANGDPHYGTFDGMGIDFMGTCTYTMAMPCPEAEQQNLPDFHVATKNQRWKQSLASVVHYVDIEVYGVTIRLHQNLVVIYEGAQTSLPVSGLPNGLRIYRAYMRRRMAVVVETAFGLRVSFDGSYSVEIVVPADYKTFMCGICGNYDGDPENDLRGRDGAVDAGFLSIDTTLYNQLGETWRVPGAVCEPTTQPPICTSDQKKDARETCDVLKNRRGPFSQCVIALRGTGKRLAKNCIFDVCIAQGDHDVFCESIEFYVDACNEVIEGFTYDWRAEHNCPYTCPDNNMEHKENIVSCPGTCDEPNGATECVIENNSGCVCKTGYVLFDNVCIEFSSCGCKDANSGNYYQVGDSWSTDHCGQRCTCEIKGNPVCEEHVPCGPGSRCGANDLGEWGCQCATGFVMINNACENVDECEEGIDNCHAHADCIDSEPGFSCVCRPGYEGDGETCIKTIPVCLSNDGSIHNISDSYNFGPCMFCYCHLVDSNPREECAIMDCPPPAPCVNKTDDPTACCPVCHTPGCLNGDEVVSLGEPYINHEDACQHCICGQAECYYQDCARPDEACEEMIKIEGECCQVCVPSAPVCEGSDGQEYKLGERYQLQPCVECSCEDMNGTPREMCMAPACMPVAPGCLEESKPNGACCPTCLKPGCQNGPDNTVAIGESYTVYDNPCVTCVCGIGYGLEACMVRPCALMDCPNLVSVPGQCCPVCRPTHPPPLCEYNGNMYEIGSFRPDPCVFCECKPSFTGRPEMECIAMSCMPRPTDCIEWATKHGECCAKCESVAPPPPPPNPCDSLSCPDDVGWEVIDLPAMYTGKLVIFLDKVFDCPGTVTGWKYYRNEVEGVAYLGVIRKIRGRKAKFVGSTKLPADNKGVVTYFLPDDDKIFVRQGDILAMFNVDEVVPSAVEQVNNDCGDGAQCYGVGAMSRVVVSPRATRRRPFNLGKPAGKRAAAAFNAIMDSDGKLMSDVTALIFEEKEVRCSHSRRGYKACELGGFGMGVQVKLEQSKGACLRGETFGLRGTLLWVTGGCRAQFDVLICGVNDQCPAGYRFDKTKNQCVDINECQDKRHICGKNAPCINRPGSYDCMAYCRGSGDPHYRTFDGQVIHFQGKCKYTLAKPCPQDEQISVPRFDVQAKNRAIDAKPVSVTQIVYIVIGEHKITLDQGNKVYINGVESTAQFTLTSGEWTITGELQGRNMVVSTDFELTVMFDGRSTVQIMLPDIYKFIGMCGVCGNFNGDRADEWQLSDGTQAPAGTVSERAKAVGDSWLVSVPGDTCSDTPLPPDCPADKEAIVQSANQCGALIDTQGAFSDCLQSDAIDAQQLFDDCVFDGCHLPDATNIVCMSMLTLFTDCIRKGYPVYWNRQTICPDQCGPNEEFRDNIEQCELTCAHYASLTSTCYNPPSEGCVCKEGYVRSNLACIEPSNCGCFHEGTYFAPTHTYKSCSEECACTDGEYVCTKALHDCGEGGVCYMEGGVPMCRCQGEEGFILVDGKCEKEDCGENQVGFRENCYEYIPEPTPFTSAEHVCAEKGGRMAMLSDAEINAFVQGLIQKEGHRGAFIGLNDVMTEGQYVWSDQSTLTMDSYKNWARNQPRSRNPRHDCVFMDARSGKWLTSPCFWTQPFICEFGPFTPGASIRFQVQHIS